MSSTNESKSRWSAVGVVVLGFVTQGCGGMDGSQDPVAPPGAEATTATVEGAPPTPYVSTEWTGAASVSASVAELPPKAFDGNITTRWTTGRAQIGDEAFIVDLGAAMPVSEVVLDDSTHPTDYPAAYALDLSSDGKKFTSVETGIGSMVTIVCFPESSVRFVRIRQTGASSLSAWSIDELRVYP
jgi:F5/8 type C domain